ncbi:MAG: cell wall hydrolase, partial [Ketobacter sp.]|nr:cell wall hydrolase [Ketobacter sp.]
MAGSQGFKGFGVGSTSIHVDMGGSRSWGYAGGVSSGKGPAPLWARGAIKDAHRGGGGGGGSTRSTYSAQDKDFMIRTMLGEAGAESDEGLAGVAAVLRNRVEHGDFGGRTGKDVSLAKNQFETWQKHGARLKRISKSSPEYKRAQSILEGILQGQSEDPTGGAYYFVSGGIRTPSTKNPTRRIGGHEFFIGPGGKAHVSQAG